MEKSNIFLKNSIDLLVISPYNQSMKALTFFEAECKRM
jgi:hypothetical protein